MPRAYERPPIVEAVCEFRFESEEEWDWSVPGLLYDRIRDDFPQKIQQNAVVVSPPNQPAAPGVPVRLQFGSQDGTRMVQVGPNLLSINELKPYSGWADFRSRIIEVLRDYFEVASPVGISRTGLRYVNRIAFSEEEDIDAKRYFTIFPQFPPTMPNVLESFVQQGEVKMNEGGDRLRIIFGAVPSEGDEMNAVILDLDYFATQRIGQNDAPDWIDQAHAGIEMVFDSCFTELTHHEVFGEVADSSVDAPN